jgi:hypothetical protein
MKRTGAVLGIVSVVAVLLPASSVGSHSGPGGSNREFAVGAAKNTFFQAFGPNHLMVSAHRDPAGGDPTGHVRAKGDIDGPGPMEPFAFEGEVTCVRVEGNRAAIKYRFKHAEGSGEPFEGGGVQVFVEDNGPPNQGQPDANTFDAPQLAGAFDTNATDCSDPQQRQDYDPVESGNYTVHDVAP